jgi:hypothetical protein
MKRSLRIKEHLALAFCALFVSSVFTPSCKKFVDIIPEDRITSDNAFADSINAVSSVVGIYIDMHRNASLDFLTGGITIYSGLTSDEIIPTTGSPEIFQFYRNSISPTANTANNSNLWQAAYKTIYATNACIEGIKKSNGLSQSLKLQLVGEVRLMRGICYFNLSNLYGQVPLVLNTDYNLNRIKPKTTIDSVLQSVEEDFIAAREMLSDKYVTTGRLRPNRKTALAFLSRFYLYKKNWTEVVKISTEIINDNRYSLESLDKAFLANNKEAIWQIASINEGLETIEGFNFVPFESSVIPDYIISDRLLNDFDFGDARKTFWLNYNSVDVNGSVKDFYFPFKYKLGYDGWSGTPLENYTMIRLAEVILNRAEARMELNDFDGAIEDLKLIRSRAQLPDYSFVNKDGLRDAINHERRIELFCEWGHRWFDLRRNGKINEVMNEVAIEKGTTWDANWALYPIPYLQIQANPFLKQNNGYPE